jgi:hypothetical protein
MEASVNIIIDKGSKRVEYVCEILFTYILKVPYRIVEKNSIETGGKGELFASDDLLINYSSSPELNGLHIPNIGLLNEDFVRTEFAEQSIWTYLPSLFPVEGDYDIPFDFFSACFYLLTEYELSVEQHVDQHGRYDEQLYPIFRNSLHHPALVHEYALLLWEYLGQSKQNLPKKEHVFSWHMSFDIDHPWAFKHKGIINLFAGISDLLRLDFRNFKSRWKTLTGAQDPYDSYAFILDRLPKEKCSFFFLLNRKSKQDGRYTYRNKHYRALMSKLATKSAFTGIHPSYTTSLSKQAIQMEMSELKAILGEEVRHVRQHFLKYSNPQTRRYYIQLGLLHDHNACMISDVGFRQGMGIPFPWFDLLENEPTPLIIHPVMAMDVTLKDYLNLSPEQALSMLKSLCDYARDFRLELTFLWHNSSLTTVQAWEGWKEVFSQLVSYLEELDS